MSSDFQKVLVKDDRLHVTDSVKYAVLKGGQNVTQAQFNAVSSGPSSIVFNVQVPSEQTLIDRRVLWRAQCQVAVRASIPAGTAAGIPIFDYGAAAALAPFPLHSTTTTMTATINNNSVTINQQDTLPVILRMLDREELALYNGYCPNAYDTIKRYTDAIGTNANVLGGLTQSTDGCLYPRGSWVLDSVVIGAASAGAAGFTTNGNAGAYTQDFTVAFTSTEPLLISPFIYADPKSNNQAIYGIQNLNFQFNVNVSGSRVLRFAPAPTSGITYTNTISSFAECQLLFTFLTPHPSDLIPARNVVPYYELPRYITGFNMAAGNLLAGTSYSATSQSLQLNQIPDKLIIFVRKQLSNQLPTESDSFMPISQVRINFNNQSGILSATQQQDLYAISVSNGSNQSWYEFSGRGNVRNPAVGSPTNPILTTGSLLVLEFGKDIQLTEDFYAAGSLGNFNLQVIVNGSNYDPNASGTYELVIITMNSGVFVCERGTSSTYTGILTKQDVLDASSMEAYTGSDVERMVGGGFLDSLKSVAGMIPTALPVAKAILGSVDNPYAKGASSVLGALGYAKPKGKLSDRLA